MPTFDVGIIRDTGAVGVLIVVLGLILRGELVPKAIYQREIARADRAEARLDRATRIFARFVDRG